MVIFCGPFCMMSQFKGKYEPDKLPPELSLYLITGTSLIRISNEQLLVDIFAP
ncbi:hypothetical protein D3C71_1748350 [compost metagenome]